MSSNIHDLFISHHLWDVGLLSHGHKKTSLVSGVPSVFKDGRKWREWCYLHLIILSGRTNVFLGVLRILSLALPWL